MVGGMRDYILLYINGREHKVSGDKAFIPVTDYLRYDLSLCGTKVVCAEGDCGACTVMIGRVEGEDLQYKPINSCIQYIFQLDCSHVVTVEGLKLNGKLNPVQEAMVECHGAQCGYCTPGFIVAMCSMFDEGKPKTACELKDGLTGNLCRCTGYESIVKAGLEVDLTQWQSIAKLYPAKDMVKEFETHLKQSVGIKADGKELFVPVDVKEACKFKNENPGTVIITGGTDVAVFMNKRGLVPDIVMATSNLPGLSEIVTRKDGERTVLEVGARVTLKMLEDHISELSEEMKYILWVFGSPQIRHAGTLAGNVANASPIGDTPPFLFTMDAEIEATGVNGVRRIKMTEFYLGYKKLALQADEMITKIHVPLPTKDEIVKLYKVSRRQHLDISAFTAAIRIKVDKGKIQTAAVTYGGVAAVVMRLPKVEQFLVGKEFSLATCREAGKLARAEVVPISDVRGSRDFRLALAENIFSKFYHETAERELVCQ
jgi:xanthine dehydrogenase small subunit